MANEKILVVDDDKNICELLRLYLVKEGYNVTMVHDGGAALAEFDKMHPDLVLLDEPGTGLDVNSMALVRREMLAARERGACVIVVSHDLAGDSPLADRLQVLAQYRSEYPHVRICLTNHTTPQGLAAVDSVLNAATGNVAASTAGEVPA